MSLFDEVRKEWEALVRQEPSFNNCLDLTDDLFRKYVLLRLEVIHRELRFLRNRGGGV